ncbi:MAG: deoxyribose-phosphate aldolase [Spirochaetales bacterium]|nr:deoxyribose-phosphate aldolase [Spirochaetales bacterium]
MEKLPVNRYLDHAVLKPEMTREEAKAAIQLGIDYKVRTVCVRPCDIALAAEMCGGTETEVSCVLSFPHGTNPSAVKAEEARQYIALGAHEIDMVANYGFIRSALWDEVEADIKAVTDITGPAGIPLKVIFETSQLTTEQIKKTTEICIKAKADFVKTSTGFYGEGATVEGVRAMVEAADSRIKIKPSGGIRTTEQAQMFIDMGVHRLGNGYTSTKAICEGTENTSGESY